MANLTTLLKYSLKTNIIKVNYNEIISRISRYYYAFGKTQPWPTVTKLDELTNEPVIVSNEDMPPSVSDTYDNELDTRKDIIFLKAIEPNDVALVVNRYDWVPGQVYDQYDVYTDDKPAASGAIDLSVAKFFVLTDEFNVYKCLFNNGNAISVDKPTGTSPSAFTTDDGYIWKFMYTIPLAVRNKFLQSKFMPIVSALTDQFYGKGTIRSYLIENPGAKYISSRWKVISVNIINGGSGYTTGTQLVFDAPPAGGGNRRATAVIGSVNAQGTVTSIIVTDQGRGYRQQPTLRVVNAPQGAVGLQFLVNYERDFTTGFTALKITGDGFNELNPYSIKNINIVNRGTFNSVPSGEFFAFPAVQVIYGTLPDVDVTFRPKASIPGKFEIDTIIINSGGFGYTTPLIFGVNVFAPVLADGGADLDFDAATQKNDAEAIPIVNSAGQITAIQITQPGIGYTFANVEVIGKRLITTVINGQTFSSLEDISDDPRDPRYIQGFVKASISLGFGVGDADSKQSDVELLAVDGSIEVINVDEGGSGYSDATILTVLGDGFGCTCQPVVVDGSIKRVIVTNKGRGYTRAVILSNSGVGAVLRPIMSPKGGHGKDAISELYCNTLALYTRLSLEKNKGIPFTNDVRQISIIKDPYVFAQQTFFRLSNGSACGVVKMDINDGNTLAFNNVEKDDILFVTGFPPELAYFFVVEKTIVNGKYVLVLAFDYNLNLGDYDITGGISLIKRVSDTVAYLLDVGEIIIPDVDKYSGQMLYTDNRVKFAFNNDQSVAITTLITF